MDIFANFLELKKRFEYAEFLYESGDFYNALPVLKEIKEKLPKYLYHEEVAEAAFEIKQYVNQYLKGINEIKKLKEKGVTMIYNENDEIVSLER